MSKCWDCKNLNKSIHMKLENDILYNAWCKVGDMEDENCSKFLKDGESQGINSQETNLKGSKSL